jgi:hypothetical protein
MNSRFLLRNLLMFLVILLTFEGLGRKLVASGIINQAIFFAKDMVVIVMLFVVFNLPANRVQRKLSAILGLFGVALVPLIFLTGLHDPVLAVFGAKQYLLFSVVALSIIAAYIPHGEVALFRLLTLIAVMVVPTTLVAVYQQRLPASHWLNTSTEGGALSAFSAGGYLRVSSTFSFVAQYCMFLNAACYAIPAAMQQASANPIWRLAKSSWVLIPFLLVGMYITGSRGAVVGCTVIVAVGGAFLLARGGGQGVRLAIGVATLAMATLLVLREKHPEYFAAYEARTETVGGVSHGEQMLSRVSNGVFGWTDGLPPRAPASLFGYGLGVMSNGPEKMSKYAASWRTGGFWTETDQSTVLFEGGFYLVIIWYGLRFWIIGQTLLWTVGIKRFKYLFPACFAAGFVTVNGVVGTLSIQPPVAIWWWTAVGVTACMNAFDRQAGGQRQRKI